MPTKKEYNGWFNYETWLVKLWIDNEEGSSRYWDETAQEVYNDSEGDRVFTRDERAALNLSDRLKDEFEEAQPELEGFWADLLNASMSEVSWHEIAEHYISDVDKEEVEHSLIIHSLHDAQLECSCGAWTYAATGACSKEQAEEQFQTHVRESA